VVLLKEEIEEANQEASLFYLRSTEGRMTLGSWKKGLKKRNVR
jgi:hypothetical protein